MHSRGVYCHSMSGQRGGRDGGAESCHVFVKSLQIHMIWEPITYKYRHELLLFDIPLFVYTKFINETLAIYLKLWQPRRRKWRKHKSEADGNKGSKEESGIQSEGSIQLRS